MDTPGKNKRIKDGFEGQRMFVLPPHIKRAVLNNPINRGFYLTALGYYPKALNHERERRSGSGQYILIYCMDGAGMIHVNGEDFDISSNNYFIIPKHAPHRYHSSANDPWSIYWLHFDGELAPEIYSRSVLNDRHIVHEIPYQESRVQVFDDMCSIIEKSYNKREMEAVNFHSLHFITSLIYHRETHPPAGNADMVSRSIDFMNDNISHRYGLTELAQQQNISVTHYAKMFKQKTGETPVNYFNRLKVQKACQNLYFTDRSIKLICGELGFDDQYYFSRLFRKVTGISPLKYKLMHINK